MDDEIDEFYQSGWSVLAVGGLQLLTEEEFACLQFGKIPKPWAAGPRGMFVRLPCVQLTGRRSSQMVADPTIPLDGAPVLVTYASRWVSTAEIGEAIAERLRAAGLDFTVVPVSQAPDPEGFDAVVCGSAIYAARWVRAARHYVRQHRQTLA
jgi:hypothetical protein